jgi:hypothetical protein
MVGFIKNLLGLVPTVVGMASDHLEAKRKLKQVKVDTQLRIQELQVRSAEGRIDKGQDAEIEWNNLWAKQAETSWKDEFWTIVISIPAIMAFIPGLAEYVLEGFIVLEQMPQWYQAALGLAIAAAFGVQKFTNYMQGKGNK